MSEEVEREHWPPLAAIAAGAEGLLSPTDCCHARGGATDEPTLSGCRSGEGSFLVAVYGCGLCVLRDIGSCASGEGTNDLTPAFDTVGEKRHSHAPQKRFAPFSQWSLELHGLCLLTTTFDLWP